MEGYGSTILTYLNGDEQRVYYRKKRAVSQHIEMERMLDEYGRLDTVALLVALIVLACDENGARLFKAVEFKELANKIEHDELVRVAIAMGGVEEVAPDPKD